MQDCRGRLHGQVVRDDRTCTPAPSSCTPTPLWLVRLEICCRGCPGRCCRRSAATPTCHPRSPLTPFPAPSSPQRLTNGELSSYDELFSYACPKFITAAPPSYDSKDNTFQEAYRNQLNLFIKEVKSQQVRVGGGRHGMAGTGMHGLGLL